MRSRKAMRPMRAALGLVLVLVAAPAAFAATRTAKDADIGATIRLKIGDTLEVRLQSNPSTGYSWSLDPHSTPIVEFAGQSQAKAKAPGVGRSALQVLRFKAAGRGEGALLLRYARSWEEPSPDDRKYDLLIVIR